jgi:hypothetical protein
MLERFPQRCQMAPEGKSAKRPLRHLLYGSRRDVYCIIFEIDGWRMRVRVLTVRHGAMERFSRTWRHSPFPESDASRTELRAFVANFAWENVQERRRPTLRDGISAVGLS